VVFKGPMTTLAGASQASGFLGAFLKFAGFDGIVVQGAAPEWCYLFIHDGQAELHDAHHLLGLDTWEVEDAIVQELGVRPGRISVYSIGPAGENMVPFACILNEAHHAFGRCGMGAVMGSKNLKALVVNSEAKELSLADPDRIKTLVKELTPRIKNHLISQVLHDFGTSGNLEGHMYNGDVPVRNWTSNFDEVMGDALTGSTLSDRFLKKTATCAYCAVAHGVPLPLDPGEPRRLAEAVEAMALRHVVVTSVDRDDVPDGGAAHYAAVVQEIRLRTPATTVEVLIPDFKGNEDALRTVVDAHPDILNHNLETVPRLYRMARPGGRYDRALELLARAKRMDPQQVTKSGIMVGLGETWEEAVTALRDLRAAGTDLITVGQYLRPSAAHMPVARFYTPDEFAELARIGKALGFRHTESGPLVRSSYHAWEQAERSGALAQV
jgi:lipoic acid synthetase